MTTVMTRSFADSMGFNWPPEWASCVDGKPVTFAELKVARIERQNRHLELIMENSALMRRAAHIWTFFVPGWIYGGWHLYIRTIRHQWRIGRRFGDDKIIDRLMKQFPCGLLPIPENFYAWKEAFAKTYSRPSPRRKKQGLVACWVDVNASGNLVEIYF